jgi:hypothetical protein
LRTVFVLSFGAGLAIGVYTMLHGVEKSRGAIVSRPAPYLNLPALAVLMIAFGAVGYLLVRNTMLSPLAIGVIAAASGVGGWLGMSFLMAKWALRPSENAHDEAEEFQGQLAVVVTPITPNAVGSIRYERNGRSHETAARNMGDGYLPAGADVVIDRFEADVAIVEDWAAVEQRL